MDMAPIKRLKRTNDLKVTRLIELAEGKKQQIYMRYDDESDALLLLFVSPEIPTIVHYIDNHVALLYTSENNEVVGIQVDDFETSFIDEYVNVKKVWRLSDACENLNIQNLGDLSIAFERQKPVMAREVAKITEDLLFRRRPDQVPA